MLDLEVMWRRFDRTEESNRFTLGFQSQRSDIDWDSLTTVEPYDLEPVTSEAELIGRGDFLNQLVSMVSGPSVGSAVVYGQKRVGKTSLVKTFGNRLMQAFQDRYIVIYVEGGEYVRPDPVRTIEALGRKLCEELQNCDERARKLRIPAFDGAFAPFGDFLNDVLKIVTDRRLIFILDEFDELPTDLYTHNSVADSFFLSLRSASAKANVGFILVGSEKMQAILGIQGHELNKFKVVRVDYFDREQHWGDFVDLVRRPAQDILEFSDHAVSALYETTAGNPYFTKLICKSVFKAMVNRRDSHVTESEIALTIRRELLAVGVNSFLHFWDDGIVETGEDRRRVSETRQKTLLSYVDVSRRSSIVTAQQVAMAGAGYDLPSDVVSQEIEEFTQRKATTYLTHKGS